MSSAAARTAAERVLSWVMRSRTSASEARRSTRNRTKPRASSWASDSGVASRASQTLTVPSTLAEAMRVPSGLNATPKTQLACPLSVSTSSPVAASQTFTDLSSLAEAMREPSGLNATPWTKLVCPVSVRTSCPVATSQTFTVVSWLAEAMPCAVGAERHALDTAGMPRERVQL